MALGHVFCVAIIPALYAASIEDKPGAADGVCSAADCVSNVSRGSSFIQSKAPLVGNTVLQPDGSEQHELLAHSLSEVGASGSVTIVSYNLYWWNVRQNNRWNDLWNAIRSKKPFDMIGFQECDDVASVVRNAGLNGFDYYLGPKPNPAPLAWNGQVFSRIGGPGNKYIATDKWGRRHFTWVRLRHNPTGAKIFFANTHGPLDNCSPQVGNNWVAGINENKQAGDIVFMTGDFNCGTGTPAMNILKGQLPVAVDSGIDQILSDRGQKQSGDTNGGRDSYPSDHPLIKGSFSVRGNGGTGQSGCQDGNRQCPRWAQAGECTRNPNYMLANCKCVCSGGGSNTNSCRDSSTQCTYWANNGECTRNPRYMAANCKRSCKVC